MTDRGLFESDAKTVLANVFVIYLSVSLVIVGLEVSLRATTGDPPEKRFCGNTVEEVFGRETPRKVRFHRSYGRTLRPNIRLLEKRTPADDWSYYETNAQGFRDVYDSGERNVLVLGDSFTQGNLVDQNATYSYLLDRWTRDTAFHNYGIGGYGTGEELVVYRNVSRSVSHSVVVLGYFVGNDMQDNATPKSTRPEFEIRNGSLVKVRDPEKPDLYTAENRSGSGLIRGDIQVVQNFLNRQTVSYSFIGRRMKSILIKTRDRTDRLNEGAKKETDSSTNSDFDERARLTRALLNEFAEETSRNNATLVIVSIPPKHLVARKNKTSQRPDAQEEYRVQYRLINNVSSNHDNVEHIDLRPAFRKKRANGVRLYGKIDSHMDDAGHRVTARVLYDYLNSTGYIRESGTVNFTEDYSRNVSTCP